jgi:hypothetical protein
MTRIHVHELTGFNPDSLATYLAALGIFRLLAEQKDACVRGLPSRRTRTMLEDRRNGSGASLDHGKARGIHPRPDCSTSP